MDLGNTAEAVRILDMLLRAADKLAAFERLDEALAGQDLADVRS